MHVDLLIYKKVKRRWLQFHDEVVHHFYLDQVVHHLHLELHNLHLELHNFHQEGLTTMG